MSKRILSLVLTLALVLGSFSMAFAAPADVVGTEVEDAVERLGNLGILEGYPDGSFKPEGNITRAEFAAVVARATGLEKAAIKGATAFGDVPASHWASGYVRVAEGAGLIKGMGKVNGVNTFAPEANISYEQAVTMVVRALGYEPAALENGGYPTGHLIVASREGLLQEVNGVAGQLATRGLVAQLVDNALDVPKMIAVAYDGKTKYVKSGAEGTKEQYLFNDLQLSSIEGTLSADKDKNKVTVVGKIADKDATKSLIVTTKDFDYAGLDGLKVQAWFNKDDKVVSVKVLSENIVKYDGVKINKTNNKVTTVTEDKDYDFAKVNGNVRVEVKGQVTSYDKLDPTYSFAKLVLDEYGDVRWIEVYNLNEMLVVSEVKDNNVKGYGNDEIADANKYKVLKDGKEISFSSLKDGDVVLYNSGEKYAAVAPKVVKGKIDTVYSDSFKFEGKNYDNAGVKYVSDKDLLDINDDVLKEMKDNGEVEVFFNFNNKAVVVNGDVKEVASNYVMVTKTAKSFTNRNDTYVNFDYMDSEGNVIKNDLKVDGTRVDSDIVKDAKIDTLAEFEAEVKAGKVLKASLDAKGKLTKIETVVEERQVSSDFKLSASYVQGFKLQSSTTVFYNDASDSKADVYKDYKVANLTDAKKAFSEVKKDNGGTEISKISVDKNGNIVAIVAVKTDVAEEGTWLTGIVTDVRTTTNDIYVTLKVNDVEKEYKGKNDVKGVPAKLTDMENAVYDLKVTEDGAIKEIAKSASDVIVLDKAATTTELAGKIGTTEVNLVVEGKYYEVQNNDEFKKIDTSKFTKGKEATVYYRNGSKKFVQVVVMGANEDLTATQGVVTYINNAVAGQEAFAIDGTVYAVTSDMVLKSKAGAILETGTNIVLVAATNELVAGDQVTMNGKVITVEKRMATVTSEFGVLAAKLSPVANPMTEVYRNDTIAARAYFNKLAPVQKALITTAATDLAKLTAAETAVVTADATALAAPVKTKITALPAAASVTLANKAAINEARADYEALSPAVKAIVDAPDAGKDTAHLIAAEGKLATLEATLLTNTTNVAEAKAALTTLGFDTIQNAFNTSPLIKKPANHATNGATYTLSIVPGSFVGNDDNGTAVMATNDVSITRDDSTPFTFQVKVTIKNAGHSSIETDVEDTLVFTVNVTTGLSEVKVVK